MEFIKRLRDEDKLEELKKFFETVFCGLQWKFEYEDFNQHNFIKFNIFDENWNDLAYFNITNFNCTGPINLDPKSKHTHLYGGIPNLYLKFMKNTFPEYKNEYIKNLKLQLVKEVDEFMSL